MTFPIALPLASCQPGAIHSTPDGRAWYGHGDRIDPNTGILREAQLVLTSAPRQGDDLWVDAHAISGVAGAPSVTWPTLSELEAGIAECQAALAARSPGPRAGRQGMGRDGSLEGQPGLGSGPRRRG